MFKTWLTDQFGERVGQFSAIGNDEPNTDFFVWFVQSSFLWEIRIILYSPCHNTISVLHFILFIIQSFLLLLWYLLIFIV
jgi:hypothetical protein